MAECRFLARHLSIIALMIEARQMQNSVEGEDFHFHRGGVAIPEGIVSGDVGGNRDLACESVSADLCI